MSLQVSSLYYYPIKSCKGIDLKEAFLDNCGIAGDRSLLVTAENGNAITQRDFPKLALVKVEIKIENTKETVCLSAPAMQDIQFEKVSDSENILSATVWGNECDSVSQGEQVAFWFSKYLGINCKLVSKASHFVRPVEKGYIAEDENHQVAFADAYPFLLITEASLNDLNKRLTVSVPMNRFRPNIVVSGAEPFAEDSWHRIKVGEIEFSVVKPCSRCVMVTIDQETANKAAEPLKTMANFRQVSNKVMFGQNLVHHNLGKISVGDEVDILK